MRERIAIKAVIFDVGGVLVRTDDQRPRERLAERMGVSPRELSELVFESGVNARATVGEAREEDVWKHVSEHFQLNDEELTAFRKAFWEGDQMDAGLINFIQSLRTRYRTGLLSNALDGARKVFSTRFPLIDAFDVSIISAEVGLAKPDTKIYQLMLERLGVQPSEAVFVDDVLANVEAARSIGMHGIQFKTREQAIQDLEGLLGLNFR